MALSVGSNGCISASSAVYARLAARAAQFVLCMLALALTSAGYRVVSSAMTSSPSAIFAILMTYTGMLYALWHGVAVEIFRFATRPTPLVEIAIDSLLAVLLLIAAIAQAASDLVSKCSDYSDLTEYYGADSVLRCGNLKAGVAFAFIAVAAFVVSVVLQFFTASPRDANDVEAQQQYADESGEVVYHQTVATPVQVSEPLSPIGKSTPAQHAV